MTTHKTNSAGGYFDAGLIAGDGYIVDVSPGSYEFTTAATSYGAGTGITISRLMPDLSTKVIFAGMTSVGTVILYMTSGRVQIDVAGDVTGGQVVFGKV